MIPRAYLFANPRRAATALSPDGAWLSWAAAGDGVMNLWVAPLGAPEQARQLTFDPRRGVVGHSWTYDARYLLFSQDRDGDENFQLYSVQVDTGRQRCLTPYPGTRAGIAGVSRLIRDRVLISLNRRDPRYGDFYTLHLESGELELVAENPGYTNFVIDQHYRLHFATQPRDDGGFEILQRQADGHWRPWSSVPPEDARSTGLSHLSADARTLYAMDSRGRDTPALSAIDLDSGERRVLVQSEAKEIGGVIVDPEDFRPLACYLDGERAELQVLDESIRADVDFLEAQQLGEWGLHGRTEDDRRWLIGASTDRQPGALYLYDRARRTLEKLHDARPELAGHALARMQSFTVPARDGLPLVCYLTLPTAVDTGEPLRARQAVPLVLHVHGGPWVRDHFGYNPIHQWLADRGYAVLNVNFRSSTGFGKAFINAGNGEWGGRMDEDLEDAVNHVIGHGLADPTKLAIYGMSYGGFAVLSALTRYPGRYACGIDVVGPSNLETLMHAVPPHWESQRRVLYRSVGDPTTAEGLALLRARSPLHAAGAITDPLLIGQGANDPRVLQSESDQMVQAMVDRDIPVTYALFPDEGHGFSREPNRMVFNALTEAFLAAHLGGALEPFTLAVFPGHSLQILRSGEDLADAIVA